VPEAERYAQLFCWVLPGFVAGWAWGLPVGLLTFGGQMFAAQALVRLYIRWRITRGEVALEEVRRFVLVAHLVSGSLLAFVAKWAVGGVAG